MDLRCRMSWRCLESQKVGVSAIEDFRPPSCESLDLWSCKRDCTRKSACMHLKVMVACFLTFWPRITAWSITIPFNARNALLAFNQSKSIFKLSQVCHALTWHTNMKFHSLLFVLVLISLNHRTSLSCERNNKRQKDIYHSWNFKTIFICEVVNVTRLFASVLVQHSHGCDMDLIPCYSDNIDY